MSNRLVRIVQLFLIFLTSLSSVHVYAQEVVHVNIDYVDNDQFPLLEAYIAITNAQGIPVKNLTLADFKVFEDGNPIHNFEITPIQNKEQPIAIVLLIDTSGSMAFTKTSNPLQDAVTATQDFVSNLSSNDQVAIVNFSNIPQVVREFTNNKDIIKDDLESLKPGGNTALYDGIALAVNILRNRMERKMIILVTDGVDSANGSFNLDTAIDEAQDIGVPIYPIGFGNIDRKALERIALSTSGFSQIKPDSSELTSALNLVLQIFREQYLIRFDSNLNADGLNHNLQVSVNGDSSEIQFVALPLEVEINLPYSDGDVVGGNILFAPEVIAPAPLRQLDIFVDEKPLQTILSAPFEYAWDSTTISPGKHQFNFVVTDSAGNNAEENVTLNVRPPVIMEIIAPVSDQELSGSSTVTVSTDSLDAIASVEYFVDKLPIQTLYHPPYEVSVNWDKYSKGLHLLEVKTTDVNGFVESKEVYVQVRGTYDIWFLVLVVLFGLTGLGIALGMRIRRKAIGTPISSGQEVLREIKGAEPGRVWKLLYSDMGVGRKSDNYIQLRSTKTSREHAIIKYEDGKYVLHNLKPENPPLINNVPVHNQQELRPGDVVQFGEEVLRYEHY